MNEEKFDLELTVEQSKEDMTDNKETPCPDVIKVDSTNLGDGNPQEEVTGYGPFGDAETLFKAYTNLRTEFSRRTQELATLKRALEEMGETGNASVAIETEIKTAETSPPVQGAPKQPETQKNTDRIIREYLLGVKRQPRAPILIGQSGIGVTVKIDNVRSLSEATKLAQDFFKNKSL